MFRPYAPSSWAAIDLSVRAAIVVLLAGTGLTGTAAADPEPAACFAEWIIAAGVVQPPTADCADAQPGNPCAPDPFQGSIIFRCTVDEGCENRPVVTRAWVREGDPPTQTTANLYCDNVLIASSTDTTADPPPPAPGQDWVESPPKLKTSGEYLCELILNASDTNAAGNLHAHAECYDQVTTSVPAMSNLGLALAFASLLLVGSFLRRGLSSAR